MNPHPMLSVHIIQIVALNTHHCDMYRFQNHLKCLVSVAPKFIWPNFCYTFISIVGEDLIIPNVVTSLTLWRIFHYYCYRQKESIVQKLAKSYLVSVQILCVDLK